MSWNFSAIFAEAEALIKEATAVAAEVPAAVQTASHALAAAQATATALETALKGMGATPPAPNAS